MFSFFLFLIILVASVVFLFVWCLLTVLVAFIAAELFFTMGYV